MRSYPVGPAVRETIETLSRLEEELYRELGSRFTDDVHLFDKIGTLRRAKSGLVSLMQAYPGL